MNDPIQRSPNQRVVITGMGAITSVGHTVSETWEALKAGRSGISCLTLLDPTPWTCKIAGEIKDFNPAKFLPRKRIRQMTFAGQLAIIATSQALEDSDLDLEREDRHRIGVILGTAGGSSIEETETATVQLMNQDTKRMSPIQAVKLWPNMPSFYVAQTFQVGGYNGTICTACAAGTQAIGEATEVIRRGGAEVMISGGAESMVSETALAGFTSMRALATSYNDAPERAMRPFDVEHEGFVASQGCAIFILESLTHAQARGANIYAEVLGYGVSNDIYHMIAPEPNGKGAGLAIRWALESAKLELEAVDYINAHGTSTPLGDVSETNAIKSIFGELAYRIPISSTKSMVGHMMGAGGAVEAMVCVMSVQEGVIHPTINLENPDPECDLDYVPNEARQVDVKVAVSNSFGLGGQNAVLVLGSFNSNI